MELLSNILVEEQNKTLHDLLDEPVRVHWVKIIIDNDSNKNPVNTFPYPFMITPALEKNSFIGSSGVPITPFICLACQQCFRNRRNLRVHVARRHLGVRNFLCAVCGKAYALKNDLRRHMIRSCHVHIAM